MANYQRFVSYLYEYQNNTKTKNCGFCRVELRDHNCRLEIHLKLPLYPFTPTLKVYAFVPSNEKLYGILLGNASYQQGNVSGTFVFSEKNIKDSSYQFSQLGGILIQTDTGFCFASAWKDFIIYPEKFTLYEDKATSRQTKERTHELSFPTSLPSITPVEQNPEPDQSNDQTASSISSEVKIISELSISQNAETNNTNEAPDVPAPQITETKSLNDDSSLHTDNTTPTLEPALLAASMDSTCTTPNNQSTNFWENILTSYPQCTPFFDDEIHNCVQLTFKDVKKLDAYGYPIGNNAFFHHNCQSFQHFLIGKKCCDNLCGSHKIHYILAVPGIYNPKEQYMASMFGFPYFKQSQNSRCRNNCWGYWYRILPEYLDACNDH